MAGRLDPYLPRILREWVAVEPQTKARVLGGSLAFVDISGFTRLSERLARIGKAGAEELSEAISGCFTRLLAVAYGEGGSLVKFGGDALLLLFTGTEHEARACRAAFGMRRSLRDVGRLDTPAGRVVLRMSAGVHSGDIHCFLVGASHRELLVAGPGASATVEMESVADAGEILVSPETAARLPDADVGAPKGPGFLLRREPRVRSHPPRDREVALPDDVLEAYLPVAVRAHLAGEDHDPEHRQVTVGFLHFDGTDQLLREAGLEATADALHELVADVQRAVDRHGVAFLASDIDRDGGKLILAAGAPRTDGEDDERMLLALREVLDKERTLPVRAGVNRGAVFTGDVGPGYRRTYTVMGDAVNLAARLMARATAGEIIASSAVLEGVRTPFQVTTLEPFLVKGKSRPVEAVSVHDIAPSSCQDELGPLVGRQRELGILLDALEATAAGHGGVVEIVADPGLGKSRLMAELRAHAATAEVLDLVAHPYSSATPYAVFRGPVRALLGIPPEAPRAQAGRELLAALGRIAPELAPWAPLLAAVIDAETPPTHATTSMSEKFRRVRLRQAVVELLEAVLPGPALLAVEDAHWLDEASADLLAHLCDEVARLPWLVCVTRRATASEFAVPDGGHVRQLELAPLPEADAARLAEVVSQATPLAQREMAALVERAAGNPLFLTELVAAAAAGADAHDLPDSVEALIVAKIDRLAPRARRTLRHLAVLGHDFPAALVETVLPGTGPVDRDGLGELLRVEGGSVRFRHALIREAAYDSLPFRTRRALHARAGAAIVAAGDPDDEAAILSFHFFHAGKHVEAWRYSLVAAEAAREVNANAAAAELYERALVAARHVPDLDELEAGRIWEALGDVRDRMGAYQQAAAAYRTGRRHLAGDTVADARLMLKLAWEYGWLRRYSQSLRWISRGLSALEGLSTPEARRQVAQLTAWYGHFLQEQGRHARAITWCREAAAAAESSHELEALAHASRTLDWAHVSLGELDLAVHSPRALDLYQELGDLTGQADTLLNMSSIAYLRGDWHGALQSNRQAEALYERTGDEVSVAFTRANIGEILLDQGRISEAEGLFTEVLRVSQAAGRRSLVAFARRNLGRIAARAGRADDGLGLLAESLAEYEDIGARVEVIDTEVRLAEAHLLRRDPAAALLLGDRALEGARSLGGIAAQEPAIHRTRGYALLLLADHDGARTALEAALRAARARDASFEVALSLRALGDLAAVEGRPVPDDVRQESELLLGKLGVVDPPRMPLPSRSAEVLVG